jgi:hypothetical protein
MRFFTRRSRIAQAIDVRDLSDAIDELSRDRDDASEHEDAISRKAISGDAEIRVALSSALGH